MQGDPLLIIALTCLHTVACAIPEGLQHALHANSIQTRTQCFMFSFFMSSLLLQVFHFSESRDKTETKTNDVQNLDGNGTEESKRQRPDDLSAHNKHNKSS